MIIDGRKIADGIINGLKTKSKPQKFLAAVLIGDEPTMVSFVKKKEEVGKELGINFRTYHLAMSIGKDELKKQILNLVGDQNCGGIILQLPLPGNINRVEIIETISPEKDVDNLTGRATVLAPAVGVVETIIENCKLKIENLTVAVVGLGFLVGRPVSDWLKGKCAELYPLDSGDDLKVLKQADLVISGVGRAGLIKPEMLKDGATVIDFGYDFKNGEVSGDFDPSQIQNTRYQILFTPTPGGTGPILVAKLFENFYKLNL